MTHPISVAIQEDVQLTHSAVAKNNVEKSDAITFEDLKLNKPILQALTKSGYAHPTPIQAGAIPHALNGRDLLLSAQTGSGKTAAFVLPILDKLSRVDRLEKHIYALILTPTRELAQQVHDSVRGYGANVRGLYSIPLVGGAPYSGQIRALRKGVQIVIATPGRLIDHMNEGRVDLSRLDVLVLDEADRMLDMGFADDIKTILENAPQTRQTVMSSATWDGAVGKIAESFTNDPERVAIKVESAHIEESVYFCDDFHHKNKILLELLNDQEITQAVIFTATKRSTEQLTETLTDAGLKARYLHGDLPQGKRNRIISDVKNGKCDFLIATDVAARGIDISAISHVVNYDLPRQVEDYVHRIGRCGRAGRTGVAMNLCSFDDRGQLRNINRYLKRNMGEAMVEGLEPKRTPFEQEERRKKGGREAQGHRNRRDGRGFGGRREHHFDSTERRSDNRQRHFDNKPRSEREPYRAEHRFNSSNNERGQHHCSDKQERQATSDRRSDNHQNRGYGEQRSFGRRDDKPRSERTQRGGFDGPRFGRRLDEGQGEHRRRDFGAAKEFGRIERQFDKPKFDRTDKPRGYKKPKPAEEIFFAKRQAKKEKSSLRD